MTRSGVPLADGRIGTGSAENSIEGALRVPKHQEVGDASGPDRIPGAFGAELR